MATAPQRSFDKNTAHIRRAQERGYFDHGWLKTFHTFSFGEYFDPEHMGFRHLRVINEDFVAGGAGFPTHSHRDMEIITYVLSGQLQHRDSLGTTSIIQPGEIQKMSAGTGVQHSEFNPQKSQDVHLLQIWILPKKMGIPASYEQKKFEKSLLHNQLTLVASGMESDSHLISIAQDVRLYASILDAGKGVSFQSTLINGWQWLQMAHGELELEDGQVLLAGDGAAFRLSSAYQLRGKTDCEFLLFEMY